MLIPGFITNKPWKKAIAIIYYCWMLLYIFMGFRLLHFSDPPRFGLWERSILFWVILGFAIFSAMKELPLQHKQKKALHKKKNRAKR